MGGFLFGIQNILEERVGKVKFCHLQTTGGKCWGFLEKLRNLHKQFPFMAFFFFIKIFLRRIKSLEVAKMASKIILKELKYLQRDTLFALRLE